MIQHFYCRGRGKVQDPQKRRGRKTPQRGVGWHNPDHLAILSTRLRHSSLWKKNYLRRLFLGAPHRRRQSVGDTQGRPDPAGSQGTRGPFCTVQWGSWINSAFHFYKAPKNPSATVTEEETVSCILLRYF